VEGIAEADYVAELLSTPSPHFLTAKRSATRVTCKYNINLPTVAQTFLSGKQPLFIVRASFRFAAITSRMEVGN